MKLMKYKEYKKEWQNRLEVYLIDTINLTDKSLDTLRIKDLRIIILYYIQGFTAREIAKQYSTSTGTIKNLIVRTNKKYLE